MIRPEGFFKDGQRSAIQGLSWGVLPLCAQKFRQVIEAGGYEEMIWSEGFFIYGKYLLPDCSCFSIHSIRAQLLSPLNQGLHIRLIAAALRSWRLRHQHRSGMAQWRRNQRRCSHQADR